MDPRLITKCVIPIAVIVASTALGYLARRLGWLAERRSRTIMTGVTTVGYPAVGFLAIWAVHEVSPADVWLPVLGGLQAAGLALLALLVGVKLFADRQERGLFGLACGVGNHGVTMVGLVVFLLMGEQGLGYSTVFCIYTFFALVLLHYAIGRHYAPDAIRQPLWRLLLASLLDWRSIGLPVCLTAVLLVALGVERPAWIGRAHLTEVLMYLVIIAAYISIGLRLHVGRLGGIGRLVGASMLIRHGLGLAMGLSLLALARLSPWPPEGLTRNVLILQSFAPMGVFGVVAANLFDLHPRRASALFVLDSLFYLLVALPIIFLLADRVGLKG
jgi:predicted permease